jgi:hypothetical protein
MSQCVDEVTGWVGEWVGKVFVCVCVRACGCVSEWVGGRAGECIYCGGVRNKVWGFHHLRRSGEMGGVQGLALVLSRSTIASPGVRGRTT